MPGRPWPLGLAVVLWALLTAAALTLRPLLPVDETRYLTVAWEMWTRGDFLVPHLNGAPYGHKTPLLFWLMHAGWALFGVNEVWPRLIPPLAGLACLFLTRALGRALWPDRPAIGDVAPLLLLGIAVWAVLITPVMFDSLLAACVLMGLLGAVRCARGGGPGGWILLGIGFGLGALAKGPAVLPHLLFVPLLGPLWAPGESWRDGAAWRRWWLRLLGAGLLAAVIAGAWAVPALLDEGGSFAAALFRDQVGERVVDAEDHGRAIWWYLLAVPPALLPLLVWPAIWRPQQKEGVSTGVRFCAVWFAGAALSLSLISGKQLHYLLPSLPALALLAAWRIDGRHEAGGRFALVLPALPVGLVGLAVAIAPWLPLEGEAADTVGEAATGWGIGLAAVAVIAAAVPRPGLRVQAAFVAGLSTALVLAAHLVVAPVLAARFDLNPIAHRLAAWEREGRALANYGEYHGQYHFLGRLRRPMAEVGDRTAASWAADHPDGIILTYQNAVPEGGAPLFVQPFRGRLITVWSGAAAAADPQIVRRPP